MDIWKSWLVKALTEIVSAFPISEEISQKEWGIISVKEQIYGVYSNEADITFIMRDIISDFGFESTEVVGFVYGNETNNHELLKENVGKLKAEF